MNEYQEYSKIFKNWEAKRLIGSGSYGRVFELERIEGGAIYKSALKVITIPQNDGEIKAKLVEGESRDAIAGYYRELSDQLLGENRIMAGLKGNSNIVSYEDHQVVYHEDGIGCDIFIRMELLTSFIDYMAVHEIDERAIIKLGIDLCNALEVCEKKKIIHRDIKPGNIFVSDGGDFKLGDFGIARTIEKTEGGLSKKGTYRYMAPEVYRGDAYGKTVDICSLGLVMYYLANAMRTPFLPDAPAQITYNDEEEALMRRMRGERLTAPKFASNGLAQIILKACSYNSRERYQSATEMKADLEALMAGKFRGVSANNVAMVPVSGFQDTTEQMPIQRRRPTREDDSSQSNYRRRPVGQTNTANRGSTTRTAVLGAILAVVVLAAIAAILIVTKPFDNFEFTHLWILKQERFLTATSVCPQ